MRKAASGVADGLSLAAAPTFAAMAVLTAAGGAPLDAICGRSLGGMTPMYLLMAALHAGPWLRRLAR